MTIELIRDLKDLLAFRDEWNTLLQQSRSDCVFLTHEWLAAWWKHLAEDRRLTVLVVRESGELVGIAPLAERAPQYARLMPQTLEFLGTGMIGSDYLDFIVKPGFEKEVFQQIADHLTATGLIVHLSQLRQGASIAYDLAAHLEKRNWTSAEMKINVCPFIPLAGHTWESYLETLGSSHRYNFQRRAKNLVKTGMRFACASTPEEAAAALDVVIALHRKRWESRGGESEAFQTGSIRKFHSEFVELAAARGWLRLMTMWLGDAPVAALYGLHYRDTFYFYQSGFDPDFSKQSVGLVMMGLSIKTAIEEGVAVYDLLHGDEEYKFHWTGQTLNLSRIELYPPHTRALIYRRAITINRKARKMARRVLPL